MWTFTTASLKKFRKVKEKDKRRRNYFKFWTQKEWSDRSNYDLELNTSSVSTDDCARILLAAMQ